jgi:hypothetical protein
LFLSHLLHVWLHVGIHLHHLLSIGIVWINHLNLLLLKSFLVLLLLHLLLFRCHLLTFHLLLLHLLAKLFFG